MFAMVCSHVSLLTRGEGWRGCLSFLHPARRQQLPLLASEPPQAAFSYSFFLFSFSFSNEGSDKDWV